MKRRDFLAAAGAALPLGALAAGDWRGTRGAGAGGVDAGLRSADIRLVLLHDASPAVDVACAAADRAALLARCASDIDRLCGAADRPDVILLPDHALCGWDHWQPEQLTRIAPRADGAELALLSALARRHGVYLLLGGWWQPATSAAVTDATWLIAPAGGRSELRDSIVRTDIGNWVRRAQAPDPATQQELSAAGAEWVVVGSGGPVAPASPAPLVTVSQGRALGAVPPGCPDPAGDLAPFRSEVLGCGGQLLARSNGANPQALVATVPIHELRAARRALQRRQVTD